MADKLNHVKISVLLFTDNDAYSRCFTQSVLSYCPLSTIIHADCCRQLEAMLATMKVDLVFIDARMESPSRFGSCHIDKVKSTIALVDDDVSLQVQHALVDLGIDGFVCANHFLTIALRLKEFRRLDLARELVGEYDNILLGQVSELFLLHKVVDDAAIMVATLDRDFVLVTANESFSRLCGERHLKGKPLRDFLPRTVYDQDIYPALKRALAGEAVCLQSLAAVSSLTPYVQLYSHPLYDFDERIHGVSLVLNDISQLKLMQQRYQEMSREFTTLLNGISDAITLIRADGHIAWGNDASKTFFSGGLEPSTAPCCQLENSSQLCLNSDRKKEHGYSDCLVRRCLDRGEKTARRAEKS